MCDTIAGMATFLSHGGSKALVDRLVAIRGLSMSGETESAEDTLYMALTGAARYIRHYLGVRKGGPNAIFKVQTAKGCGDGLVTCVVQTRNGVGIAAKSPIVINYGNEYDVSVATTAAASDEGDAQRFRGVLGEYFAKQAQWRAAETPEADPPSAPQGAAAGTGPAPAVLGKAVAPAALGKAPTPAAAGVLSPKAAGTASSAAGAAPAKATSGLPKATAPPAPGIAPAPAGEPSKCPAVGQNGSDPPAKVAKTGEIELGTVDSPAASLILSQDVLILRPHSSVTGSKKISPKTVLAKNKDGKVQKPASSNDGPAWSFKNAATALVVNQSGQVSKLAEFCEVAKCKSVARHTGSASGTLAAKGDVFAFVAPDVAWQTAIKLASGLSQVQAIFSVKKKPDGDEVIPSGVAVATSKQIIIKAGEDLVLQ